MTTIAYRDDVLAADTQVTCGMTVDGYAQKAFRKGPVLYATTGASGPGEAFRNWIEGGMKGEAPDMAEVKEEDAHGYIFPGGSRVVWRYNKVWASHSAEFFAYGSGGALAMGAMAAGASAEDAVRFASKYDTNTGGEITVIRR